MALVLYDAQDSPTHPGQALEDKTDIAIRDAADANPAYGWSGATTAITGSGSAMSVTCAGGLKPIVAGVSGATTTTTLSGIASPTHDRRDLVTWDPTNWYAYHLGTECGYTSWTPSSGGLGPVKPAIPAGTVAYAEVYVIGAATSISTSDCVDKTAPLTVNPLTPLTQLIFTR